MHTERNGTKKTATNVRMFLFFLPLSKHIEIFPLDYRTGFTWTLLFGMCVGSFSLACTEKLYQMEIDIYCIRMCNKVLFSENTEEVRSAINTGEDMHESKMPTSNRIFANVLIVHIAI